MKSHTPVRTALLLATLSLPAYAQQPPAPTRAASGPVEVNGIVAKVNGRVITKNQLNMLLSPIQSMLAVQYPRRGEQFQAKLQKAKTGILHELIDRAIIFDEFKQLGASIKPHVIEEDIQRQIQNLYHGDEGKFREELKKNRLTMPGYREMTREKLVVQAMRQQQFSDVPPPLPNEIQKEYQEAKHTLRDASKDVITFRKIFIKAEESNNPSSTPDTQLALAEDLYKQLVKGADFAELAKIHSRDAFADKGGLQENVPRKDLAPEFASLIFEAKNGAILEPMLDPAGFTIVQVIKIEYGPAPSLSDKGIRDLIESRVRAKKTSAQFERWIKNCRKRAMIYPKPDMNRDGSWKSE